MERMTYWNEEYGCWSYRCPSGDAAKRLAAYEDTGMEPEEVAPIMELAEKMNIVDLVRENLRMANRLRHTEARLKRLSAIEGGTIE